jgi:hypothetical protein
MKAILQIKHDGTVNTLNGHDCTLQQAQAYVSSGACDALIQPVYVSDDENYCYFVNEEGLLLDLPFNKLASFMTGQPIVGDMLIVENCLEDFE